MTYAVILQYPGDGALEENRVELFDNLPDAVAWRDKQHEDWLHVFKVEPVSESALWDWGLRDVGSDKVMTYVHESAARNCIHPGAELVKRRKGTEAWSPVGASA